MFLHLAWDFQEHPRCDPYLSPRFEASQIHELVVELNQPQLKNSESVKLDHFPRDRGENIQKNETTT